MVLMVFCMKISRSEFIQIHDIRYHVRHWGNEGAPKLFMIHGWMDVSATFQFLVDALEHDWHVIAPDWRGFGLTEYTPRNYWFPNYIADLDALLRHYSPDEPVNLLAHSMGANISSVYVGVRSERVGKFINLEGYGFRGTKPDQAPRRYQAWLDALCDAPAQRAYASLKDIVALLQMVNPRLSDERASFLASHWAKQTESGNWEILADPMQRNLSPLLYRVEEAQACWAGITSPTLWVEAECTEMWHRLGGPWCPDDAYANETEEERRERMEDLALFREKVNRRLNSIQNLTKACVTDAGHMLQHDQPEQLAKLIEAFLREV